MVSSIVHEKNALFDQVMSLKLLRGAKNERFFFFFFIKAEFLLTSQHLTLTFFLFKIRGTLILFRLNAQPILQNFPNKGSVNAQNSQLFTLTSFARKSCVPSFVVFVM